MGKFIHLFNTEAEYEAKRSSEYTEPWVSYTRETSAVTYNKDYTEEYLTFEILNDGVVGWKTDSEEFNTHTIEYSKNGGSWASITPTEAGISFAVNAGDEIRFKADNSGYGPSVPASNLQCHFYSTCNFNVKGNIMSLINSENFADLKTLSSSLAFIGLFKDCSGLVNASNLVLPATTLTEWCYGYMFQGCTSLTIAPALPATTLASNCYRSMFNGCTSLVSAPAILPATTLASNCYSSMFNGCTSLATAPELPATTLIDSCYSSMFVGCTNLVQAPTLPAATLVQGCYFLMFRNCTNLNYIKCLATDISANGCTNNWVNGVSSTGTFVKNANMAGWGSSENGIPANWTVQNA